MPVFWLLLSRTLIVAPLIVTLSQFLKGRENPSGSKQKGFLGSHEINFNMNQVVLSNYRKRSILDSVVHGMRMVCIYSYVWMLGPQGALLGRSKRCGLGRGRITRLVFELSKTHTHCQFIFWPLLVSPDVSSQHVTPKPAHDGRVSIEK